MNSRSLAPSSWLVLVIAMMLAAGSVALMVRRFVEQGRYSLVMAAGDAAGTRYLMATELIPQMRIRGIDLVLKESTGSVDALKDLQENRIDVAFVQGDVRAPNTGNLRLVGVLHVEPVHLLVRPEIYDSVKNGLGALQGKRINLGDPGSGTQLLARDLLRYADLLDHEYNATSLTYAQILKIEDPKHLPDAVFTVSTLPSPIAQKLVSKFGYRLVPLRFSDAYSLSGIFLREGKVNRTHVVKSVIPAYVYDREPSEPQIDVPTLGTRLLLISREGVPSEPIERLLEYLARSPLQMLDPEPFVQRLKTTHHEMPFHDGTEEYLRRSQPLAASDVADWLDKLVTIGAPLLGALLVGGQWLLRRYRLQREETFETYLLQIADIERRTQEVELSNELDPAALVRLQDELGRIKTRVLERFAAQELDDTDLLSAFLSHTSHAREYVTRLLLHQRDMLAHEAEATGREREQVWREAVGPVDEGASN